MLENELARYIRCVENMAKCRTSVVTPKEVEHVKTLAQSSSIKIIEG